MERRWRSHDLVDPVGSIGEELGAREEVVRVLERAPEDVRFLDELQEAEALEQAASHRFVWPGGEKDERLDRREFPVSSNIAHRANHPIASSPIKRAQRAGEPVEGGRPIPLELRKPELVLGVEPHRVVEVVHKRRRRQEGMEHPRGPL